MTPTTIDLGGGRSTTALHYAADSPRGIVTVLAHGAGAGQRHPFMTAVSRGLAARGVDVVTFDFPYMHEGRKAPDRAPLLEASFRRVIDVSRQAYQGSTRLFIGGKSMGGRMATHLAAEGLAGLEGVVVFGYPLHPPARPDQLRTAHFPDIAAPLLIVQGERDSFGTPEELQRFVGMIPAPVTLHVVQGGDHSLAVKGRTQADVLGTVLDAVVEWMTGV